MSPRKASKSTSKKALDPLDRLLELVNRLAMGFAPEYYFFHCDHDGIYKWLPPLPGRLDGVSEFLHPDEATGKRVAVTLNEIQRLLLEESDDMFLRRTGNGDEYQEEIWDLTRKLALKRAQQGSSGPTTPLPEVVDLLQNYEPFDVDRFYQDHPDVRNKPETSRRRYLRDALHLRSYGQKWYQPIGKHPKYGKRSR